MKQMMRQPLAAAATERARALLGAYPALKTAGRFALGALGAFVLSGAALSDALLPLAVCLVAALPDGAARLGALAGALLGYPAFFGLYAGLEGMAAAVLTFACARVFASTPYAARLWFAPGAAAAMTAILSGLFALTAPSGARAAALLGAKTLLAAVGTVGLRRAIGDGDRWAGLFALACALLGLGAVALPGGMTLGMVAASCVAVCAAGTPTGAVVAGVCGLAVDLAGARGASAAFLLAGTLCLAFGVKRGVWRAAAFTAAVAATLLVTGGTLRLIPAAVLGAAASIPLPALLLPAQPRGVFPSGARVRLQRAAEALESAARLLPPEDAPGAREDEAALFDRTADEVCRGCGSFRRCWEQHAAETCRLLREAAPGFLARGQATREDFPEFRCAREDDFLRALNRQIDALRLRRLCRARCGQLRDAAAAQLALLPALFRSCADNRGRSALRPDRFRCEVARSCAARRGGVSGDRAVSFRAPDNRFYVLLCDGMGTGERAARESRAASDLLAGLLRAGAAPSDAIALFGAVSALRGSCGFATVDLFAADLVTGQCALYKQGAAPSWCRKGRRVGAVGTASAPPGLAGSGTDRPERFALSMGEEDLLVMISDGVPGQNVAARLTGWSGGAPAELAGSLIAGCAREDDATALVISLRPRTSV